MRSHLHVCLAHCRYANEDDLIPGLGPVSLAGGQLLETRARDLKELYKVGGHCFVTVWLKSDMPKLETRQPPLNFLMLVEMHLVATGHARLAVDPGTDTPCTIFGGMMALQHKLHEC